MASALPPRQTRPDPAVPQDEPSAPASAPPGRALWQAAASACLKALTRSDKPLAAPLSPAALDARMAAAIALNDTADFSELLAHAALLAAAAPEPGAPPCPKALARALSPDKKYYLELLIAAGASPDAELAPSGSLTPRRPLHAAAANGWSSTVDYLLALGADPAALDPDGRSALILAARAGCPDTAASLIAAGSPLDILDSRKANALVSLTEGFPSGDPLARRSSDTQTYALFNFARPFLPRARLARQLLAAGALVHHPLPLLCLAIRLRDQRLLDALASRGVFVGIIPFAEAKASAPPGSPASAAVSWARYALSVAREDPQIADFLNQAHAEWAQTQASPPEPALALESPREALDDPANDSLSASLAAPGATPASPPAPAARRPSRRILRADSRDQRQPPEAPPHA